MLDIRRLERLAEFWQYSQSGSAPLNATPGLTQVPSTSLDGFCEDPNRTQTHAKRHEYTQSMDGAACAAACAAACCCACCDACDASDCAHSAPATPAAIAK